MNGKEYLSQAFRLDQKINSKLEQVSLLRNLAEKATVSCDTERVTGTKLKSPMENVIVKLIDLEEEINKDIDKLIDLKKEIMEAISNVNPDEYRLVLELRYLNYKNWEEIADKLNCSYRQIHRVHGKALLKLKR